MSCEVDHPIFREAARGAQALDLRFRRTLPQTDLATAYAQVVRHRAEFVRCFRQRHLRANGGYLDKSTADFKRLHATPHRG